MAGDEQHAAARSVHNVAGKNGRLSDAGDSVEILHHKIADGGGVDSAVIHLHVGNLLHLLHVTDASPNHAAARFGAGFDGSSQISPKEGALVDLIIHIHHHNVTLYQRIHDPLVIIALSSVLARV